MHWDEVATPAVYLPGTSGHVIAEAHYEVGLNDSLRCLFAEDLANTSFSSVSSGR